MNRKETREEAVKIVYSMDVNKEFDKQLLSNYISHFELENLDQVYFTKTIYDLIDNIEEIDNYITENSKDWKINRIAKVDLAILRVALSEILYNDSVPNNVAINEAVEICKKYSKDDSHKFINGILGTVLREIQK